MCRVVIPGGATPRRKNSAHPNGGVRNELCRLMVISIASHTGSTSGNGAPVATARANVRNTTPAASRYRSRADSLSSVRTRAAAEENERLRIVISLNDRLLWVLIGSDTLLTAPVAVSMDSSFEYAGKTWRFETPRGVRTVLAKRENPVWVPPDWHYAEVAREHALALAPMKAKKTKLSDGSSSDGSSVPRSSSAMRRSVPEAAGTTQGPDPWDPGPADVSGGHRWSG